MRATLTHTVNMRVCLTLRTAQDQNLDANRIITNLYNRKKYRFASTGKLDHHCKR